MGCHVGGVLAPRREYRPGDRDSAVAVDATFWRRFPSALEMSTLSSSIRSSCMPSRKGLAIFPVGRTHGPVSTRSSVRPKPTLAIWEALRRHSDVDDRHVGCVDDRSAHTRRKTPGTREKPSACISTI